MVFKSDFSDFLYFGIQKKKEYKHITLEIQKSLCNTPCSILENLQSVVCEIYFENKYFRYIHAICYTVQE
jgi:hypothetical protein